VVGKRKLVSGLIRAVVLRPKVLTAVGDPIDVRAMRRGDETPEEIRRITDEVMTRLVDLVESLRGEQAPADAGVDRTPD
jgi:hypothetical protein